MSELFIFEVFNVHKKRAFLMYVENLEMNNSLKWALLRLKGILFFCYKNENIRYTKIPISTRPAEKITLACYACLFLSCYSKDLICDM